MTNFPYFIYTYIERSSATLTLIPRRKRSPTQVTSPKRPSSQTSTRTTSVTSTSRTSTSSSRPATTTPTRRKSSQSFAVSTATMMVDSLPPSSSPASKHSQPRNSSQRTLRPFIRHPWYSLRQRGTSQPQRTSVGLLRRNT